MTQAEATCRADQMQNKLATVQIIQRLDWVCCLILFASCAVTQTAGIDLQQRRTLRRTVSTESIRPAYQTRIPRHIWLTRAAALHQPVPVVLSELRSYRIFVQNTY